MNNFFMNYYVLFQHRLKKNRLKLILSYSDNLQILLWKISDELIIKILENLNLSQFTLEIHYLHSIRNTKIKELLIKGQIIII